MPSTEKTVYFLSSTLATYISIGILGYGLSTDWAKITMDCARSDTKLFNGTVQINYTFFNGIILRDSCPTFESTDKFGGNVPKRNIIIIIIIRMSASVRANLSAFVCSVWDID